MSQVRVDGMQEMIAPPGEFVSCYVTSKLIHARDLIDLRKNWPKIYFTARWPATANLSSEQAKPARLWTRDNVTDIQASECVLAYAQSDDELKAVLWELGIAWANGKDLYLVGKREQYGKYSMADNVHFYESLDTALSAISRRKDYGPDRYTKIVEMFNAVRTENTDRHKELVELMTGLTGVKGAHG